LTCFASSFPERIYGTCSAARTSSPDIPSRGFVEEKDSYFIECERHFMRHFLLVLFLVMGIFMGLSGCSNQYPENDAFSNSSFPGGSSEKNMTTLPTPEGQVTTPDSVACRLDHMNGVWYAEQTSNLGTFVFWENNTVDILGINSCELLNLDMMYTVDERKNLIFPHECTCNISGSYARGYWEERTDHIVINLSYHLTSLKCRPVVIEPGETGLGKKEYQVLDFVSNETFVCSCTLSPDYLSCRKEREQFILHRIE
jgi:hypothetical protein